DNRILFPGELLKLGGNTDGLIFENNRVSAVSATPVDWAEKNTFDQSIDVGLVPDWDPYAQPKDYPAEVQKLRPEKLKGGMDPFLPAGAIRGRYNIIVDEWGPYDFRYPKLWPVPPHTQTVAEAGRVPEKARMIVQRFRVMGPPGKWKLKSASGTETIDPKDGGDVPGEIEVTVSPDKAADIDLQLTYVGDYATFDYLGNKHNAGTEIPFGYKRFLAPIAWQISVFGWDAKTDPRTQPEAFKTLLANRPLVTATRDSLQFGTSGSFLPNTPADRFATVASGAVNLPDGSFVLEVTSDDGCRVWVDGKNVIDEWHYQGPTTYTVPLSPGKHAFKIEHFEIDGYAALMAEIKKA
ncbi:MAG: hypothetical protein QOJ65_256, partial [Fimbriimonadaceae bacterium]|nr:hypothetical protein [Fimbriimonadaceae bacterium]